jgi:hypothetical protein
MGRYGPIWAHVAHEDPYGPRKDSVAPARLRHGSGALPATHPAPGRPGRLRAPEPPGSIVGTLLDSLWDSLTFCTNGSHEKILWLREGCGTAPAHFRPRIRHRVGRGAGGRRSRLGALWEHCGIHCGIPFLPLLETYMRNAIREQKSNYSNMCFTRESYGSDCILLFIWRDDFARI